MITAPARKLSPVDLVTASARSGWAPGIDVRFVADPKVGLFVIGDGSGPTYGGHYVPIALEPCLNAMHTAAAQPNGDVRSVVLAGKQVADTFAAKYGAYGNAHDAAAMAPHDKDRPNRLYHCALGISLVFLVGDTLHTAQLGLSRIYLRRRGEIRLLLLDHSVASSAGQIFSPGSPDHAHALEYGRTATTRMLGLSPNVEIDYAMEPALTSDQILLCSPGVWSHPQGEDVVRALMDARTDAIAGITNQCVHQSGLDAVVVRFRVE